MEHIELLKAVSLRWTVDIMQPTAGHLFAPGDHCDTRGLEVHETAIHIDLRRFQQIQ
jgi:hypothetical protein